MTATVQTNSPSPSHQRNADEKVYGYQTPSYEYMPPCAEVSLIDDADQWLRRHDVNLLPWQLHVLDGLLSCKDEDFTWAYTNFGFLVPRQQGKTELIVAFILLRFFRYNNRDPRKPNKPLQTIYTAQHARSCADIFARLTSVITSNPNLDSITHIKSGKGSEEVVITSGRSKGDVCKFYTRSPDSGRGTSTSVIIYDEAQDISAPAYNSISKTSRAGWNPVNIFLGTPPDETVDHLDQFESIRDAGRSGTSQVTAWMEWSPKGSHDPVEAEKIDLGSLEVWKETNPSLGYFLELSTLEAEWEAAQRDPDSFRREAVASWPNRPEFEVGAANDLDLEAWRDAELEGPLELSKDTPWTVAVSIGYKASYSTLYGTVRLADDSVYVEHLGTYTGKAQLYERMKELRGKLNVRAFVGDVKNLQYSTNELIEEQINVHIYSIPEVASAFEVFEEHFNSGKISHPPANIDFEDEVLENAEIYESGGQVKNRYWTSEDKDLPISLLKAMTLAVHAAKDPKLQPKKPAKLKVLKYH